MPFFMIRNDITKVQADAIVNPANVDLIEGNGTSKAVYEAAGKVQLREACHEIGHCDLGKAVITDAFQLPAKYIIHAVGPVWRGGNDREEKLLYSAYTEALKLAKKYKCESIAFPLLSSGSYGYPKDKAMKVAVSAISDFLMEQDMMVYMVLYDRDSLHVSKKLFASVEEYIDDHYVEENDEIIEYSRRDDMDPFESESRLNIEIERRRRFQEMQCPQLLSPIEESQTIRQPEKLPEEKKTQKSKTISDLLEPLKKTKKRSLEDIVDHLDETFSQMLLRLIDERGLKDATVYKKANIDRRHFSKIRNDMDYAPTKKTVIAFAIALELSMDEAIDLMKKAGFAFSNSSKFDVIISYFIESKNYNIFEINEVLFTYEQPTLGE